MTSQEHAAEAERLTLRDLYDADKRVTVEAARGIAAAIPIPHPLNNVQYADGISPCRHAGHHARFQYCPQEVRPGGAS